MSSNQQSMFDMPITVVHKSQQSTKKKVVKSESVNNVEDLGLNSVYKDFGNYIKNIRPNKT